MRSIVQCNPGEGPQRSRETVTPHPDRIFRCDPTSPDGRGEPSSRLEPIKTILITFPVSVFKQAFASSRRDRTRALPITSVPPKRRGRREDRVPAGTRGPSREKTRAKGAKTTGDGGEHSGLPCAMVYGLLRALLGEPAFATITGAMRQHCRQFDACKGASGPPDLGRPRLRCSSVSASASTASRTPRS